MTAKKNLVVIGNAMVGHKFLELMISSGASATWNLITFCEEPRVAYDRVNLSAYFSGKTAADLSLVQPGLYQENGIQIHIGDQAVAINREQKTVTSRNGLEVAYDKIVLATGSYPFVPPIKGNDATGTFVYRTIEDLEAMSAYAKNCKVGVVVGGGLLGLEAANAIKNMGLTAHVVEFAPRLMPVQIDDAGGSILRNKIEQLGVSVHTSKSTTEIVSVDGLVAKMIFADGSELQTDMIVFSAGIRPRDEIARGCGLEVGDRGGIVINDQCQTSDPDIYAIGECALYQNRIYGLVAPGYTMAGVVADVFNNVTTSTFAKIWKRLVDAGFESGHAYGKALRTVKSCVGSTWCRYGVQDSTSLAIELELRYRGLRSPHKLKSAVSGCTRECAEAQSKDFGVILVGISE